MHKRNVRGFTIVELLIVIVVISVLAAITVVAYNGVQSRADKAARQSELLGWKRSFEAYKSAYGSYPVAADGGYCLGPGAANGYCRNYLYDGIYRYSESASSTLNSDLQKVAKVSASTRKPIKDVVGPYAIYFPNEIIIQQVFSGASTTECPAGTSYAYIDAPLLICDITLQK